MEGMLMHSSFRNYASEGVAYSLGISKDVFPLI